MLTAQTFELQVAKKIFSKHSVLIVEDDLVILENYKLTLQQLFKNVYIANDGQEGLKLYEDLKHEVSIVMADYNMPYMNGLQLFEKIREHDKKIALMLITGDMSKDIFLKALKVKLNEFVIKPVQLKTFLVLIYQILLSIEQEKTILTQQKELEVLFNLLGKHNLITKADLNGNITYANKIFCEISGYNIEEVIGKPHNLVRHPDMQKSVFEELWTTIKSGNIWRGRVKNLAKDNTSYIVNAMVMPIRDKEGNITQYISSRHIITQEVQEGEKANEFNKHLKKNVIDLKSEKIKIKNALEYEFLSKLEEQKQTIHNSYQSTILALEEKVLKLKEKNNSLLSNLNLREQELMALSNRQDGIFKIHKEKASKELEKASNASKELANLQNEYNLSNAKYEELHKIYTFNLSELEKAKNRIKELEDVIYHYDMAKKLSAN